MKLLMLSAVMACQVFAFASQGVCQEATGVAVQPYDRLEGLRCYVPARPEVRDDRTVDRKEFRDLLLVRTSCIPSAHGHILFIQRASSGEYH
jgi:hypothetical protein